MATRSLEQRVTALEETVAGLQNLPNELADFRRETNARFDRLEQRMATDKDELYAQMRMLHEELISRIKIGRQGPDDKPESPTRRRPRPKP